MKKRLVVLFLIMALGLAALAVKRYRQAEPEGVLTLSGTVEITEVDTSFRVPGRIEKLLTDEGAQVKNGDRLALLDPAEIEQQYRQSEAAVAEAEAKLSELKTGSRRQELLRAEAQADAAKANLVTAEKDRLRYERLYREGAVSAQKADEAQRAYEAALSAHKQAVEALSMTAEGPRSEEIRAALSRLQQAKAAMEAAGERKKETVLQAPVSGTVLRKYFEAGEVASAGAPVLTVGDLERPWIKVYLPETKLGLIKLGQKAEISTDTFPGRKYEGTVSYISSQAEFTPKTVQTQEERVKLVFGVKVSAENKNGELKPGMPADVRILLK